MAWVTGAPLPDGHPFGREGLPPGRDVARVRMLGSSDYGAQVAAHFGLPYAFAWFFTDGKGGAEALDLYRKLYQPSARHPEPHTALCLWALAADTRRKRSFISRHARTCVCRATAAPSRRSNRPPSRRRTPTRRPRQRASPRYARARSWEPARRWRSVSRVGQAAQRARDGRRDVDLRRGGTARRATGCWRRRWGLRGSEHKAARLRDFYPPFSGEGGSARFSAASRVG